MFIYLAKNWSKDMKNALINKATTNKAALSLAILVSFCLMFGVSCWLN